MFILFTYNAMIPELSWLKLKKMPIAYWSAKLADQETITGAWHAHSSPNVNSNSKTLLKLVHYKKTFKYSYNNNLN